ncbi:inositol monophosphatase family protein [Roseivivax sediminis]|uniref:Myo-inositol-1(Or 4)-monophosphatase n=1 Tax=Roseivivax sediminis TaxID=936889 RepID=A0A1I1ZNY7_9RHOB|nr:3'(2'),5'-bisphosphate nucleotidase CysQ [Roseivivax sediminis]SFE33365.1 myo-inositol-1(or 4)-monophosphatase [Roseivivax sediminis]
MPATDLPLLIEAARAAAETATRHIGAPLDVREKPGGQGPVTSADLAVNDTLAEVLLSARPAYGWLSEESGHDPTRMLAPSTFIVDPIDGTRSFIDGADIWAHSLAVCDGGQVTAAVVYLPLVDKLYTASLGHGAYLNGTPIAPSGRTELNGARVLATSPNMAPKFWPNGVPNVKRSHRPSLAYRLCLVAEGRFDAMFTFRETWEWDIAAGTLVVSEAGAPVTDGKGGALRFNTEGGTVDGVWAGVSGATCRIFPSTD